MKRGATFGIRCGILLVASVGYAQRVVHPSGENEERVRAISLRPPEEPPTSRRRSSSLEDEMSVRAALQYAFQNNPELRAAYDDWVAAIEKIPQAGALENPQITVGFSVGSLLEFANPKSLLGLESQPARMLLRSLNLGLQQNVPGEGKQQTRAYRALFDARAAGERFLRARIELRQKVVAAYAELLHNRHRQEVESDNVSLTSAIHDVSLRTLAAGVGTETDILKEEVSIAEAETELKAARIDERQLRGTLNSVLGRRADAKFGPLSDIKVHWIRKKPEDLLRLTIANNPELSALAAEVQSRGAQAVLAELERNPDFSVGTKLSRMRQMLEAGFSLPVNSERIDAQVREARAAQMAQQNRYSSAVYDTLARLVSALTVIEDSERILEDYGNTLIPKQRQLIDVQLRNYGAGQGAFLDVFDTRRSLIQSERLVIEAESQRLKAMTDVEAAVGMPLMTLETVPYSHASHAHQPGADATGTAVETTGGIMMTNPVLPIAVNLDRETTGSAPIKPQPNSVSSGVPARPVVSTPPSSTISPPVPTVPANDTGTTFGAISPPSSRRVAGI